MKTFTLTLQALVPTLALAALLALPTAPVRAQAQASAPTSADSLATAIRIGTLTQQKTLLEARIKAEDQKRGAVIAGVAPATLEAMNDRQDSICLALRSQLTDLDLQIQELSPRPQPASWAQQLTNIISQQAQQPTTQGQPDQQSQPQPPQDPPSPQPQQGQQTPQPQQGQQPAQAPQTAPAENK